ncbi:nitroreductase family protein [Marinifilum sp. RC60d5]|uniref:nitroreductase family protein n=1 Tax=Marinifilum sp. RC60d5 TaxID=3458414 RepID=UPI0040352F7C
MTIKRKLKSKLPKKVLYWYYLRSAKKVVAPDLRRRVHDKVYNDSKVDKVKRNLTLEYHIIEKGLTMPVPRPGFGKTVVLSLERTIFEYHKLKLSKNDLEFKQSVSVLKEYKEFHQKIEFDLDNEVTLALNRVVDTFSNLEGIKQIKTTKEEYFKSIDAPFEEFCNSRYSVRNYTDEEVPLDVLYKCVNIAQKSPSFCNRQPTRVCIVKSAEKKQAILSIQNGNRGFGHLADTLLVITSVISTTKDIHERNENHLNGGMFSMTLLHALHQNKIGACSLNWSVSNDKEEKLRRLLNIPENEIALLVISCGYVPDVLSIASSPRKEAKEIITEYL